MTEVETKACTEVVESFHVEMVLVREAKSLPVT